MNILVPIDFSAASLNAIRFAFVTANILHAQTFLLHVVSPKRKYDSEVCKLEEIKKLEEKMTSLSNINQNQSEAVISSDFRFINLVRFGKLEEVISAICETEQIDLMILGTRDKHSIREYLFGSVSTTLIQEVSCPLIIVPEKALVNSIRNIAIATDDEMVNQPFANYVNELSEKLKTKVQRVYIYPLPKDFSDSKEEVYNPTWADGKVDPKAEMIVVRDPFVLRGLDYFIEKHEVDLLAFYIPQRKGWQKFIHRSLSKRMTYHSIIPLLIWNGNKKD